MTVLSADKSTLYSPGDEVAYKVIAADIIYGGAMVCTNVGHATEGGYAKPAEDSELHKFLGVAHGRCDNSAGAAGAKRTRVYKRGEFEFVFSGTATQADVGSPVYIVDDNTVALWAPSAAPSYGILAGYISEYVSANVVRVCIDKAVDKFPDVHQYLCSACADLSRGQLIAEADIGYANAHTDAANYPLLGVAIEAVDNSTGAAGVKNVKVVRQDLIVQFPTTQAITAYRIGGCVYADGTANVDTAAGTAAIDAFVGKITRLQTTKLAWVAINMTTESSTI